MFICTYLCILLDVYVYKYIVQQEREYKFYLPNFYVVHLFQ